MKVQAPAIILALTTLLLNHLAAIIPSNKFIH